MNNLLGAWGVALQFAYCSVRQSHVASVITHAEQEESEAQQSDTWDERGAVQAQKEVLIDEFVPGFDWEEFDDAAAELKVTGQ